MSKQPKDFIYVYGRQMINLLEISEKSKCKLTKKKYREKTGEEIIS